MIENKAENKAENQIENPKVSLIMLVIDNLEFTRRSIESAMGNAGYSNFELIIIDNGSGQETRQYLYSIYKKNKNVKILFNIKNEGFPKSVNDGIDLADPGSRYFLLLNNDIYCSRNWLKKMVKTALKYEDRAIISPLRTVTENGKAVILRGCPGVPGYDHFFDNLPRTSFDPTPEEAQRFNDDIEQTMAGREYDERHQTAFFCVILPRLIFNTIGYLDEDFGKGLCEDTFYCNQVLHAGFKLIVDTDNFVLHYTSQTVNKVIGIGACPEYQEKRKLLEQKIQSLKLGREIPRFGHEDRGGKIPVLFLTYNRLTYSKKALKALKETACPEMEILAIDNNSTDGTSRWLLEQGIRIYLNNENGGIAHGMNLLFKLYPYSKYVGKVDNDTVVPPDWIDKCRAAIESGYSVVGAKHQVFITPGEKHPIRELFEANNNGQKVLDWTFVGGSGILIDNQGVGQGGQLKETGCVSGWTEYQRNNRVLNGWKIGFVSDLWVDLLDMNENGSRKDQYDKYNQKIMDFRLKRAESISAEKAENTERRKRK